MSSLRILVIGNNPNVLFYAWRLQQSKSVSVIYVSSAALGEIKIETEQYGSETFRFKNHYESVDDLLKRSEQSVFDLVILSASSLQEISSVSGKLNALLNVNTKILVESTGFVHLEPFVRMSIEFKKLKVFSIMSEFDIRQVSASTFKQFNGKNGNCKIYLGTSMTKQTSSSGARYLNEDAALLETFKRLFSKLFPRDQLDLCGLSGLDFLCQQWSLALPKICFDPLMILLEVSQPAKLQEQILAKPLISGLITEVITVTKSMGARLPQGLDNESTLVVNWLDFNHNDTPKLLYHFLRKSASLDIDMLLLQPILLADDYGIKTPYLEFLYSMMCQLQKINNGQSELFGRLDDHKNNKDEIARVKQQCNSLQNELKDRTLNYETKIGQYDEQMRMQEQRSNQLIAENSQLKAEMAKARADLSLAMEKASTAENNLRQMMLKEKTPPGSDLDNSGHANGPTSNSGTPNMHDIEDFAVYGVVYGNNSPGVAKDESSTEVPAPATEPPIASFSRENNGSDVSLRERELGIRKKELELQEKEMELQRRAAAQPRPQKFPPQPFPGHQVNPPPQFSTGGASRKSSYSQLGGRNGRGVQGAQINSANFIDPLATGAPQRPMNNGNGIPNPVVNHAHPSHPIKATSRKNRRSNMPNLRNASSSDVLSMAATGAAPQGVPVNNTNPAPRLNAPPKSGGNPSVVHRFNNGSHPQLGPVAPIPAHQARSNSTPSPVALQQRQISTSTTVDDSRQNLQANLSVNSVVHSPLATQQFQAAHAEEGQTIEVPEYSAPGTPVVPPSDSTPTDSSSHDQSQALNQESATSGSASPSVKKKSKFGIFGKKKKSQK
ncbi:LAMI_0H02234g1_1 [Lachancea mirantina]|uniref:LAMI_0H02234g1_1 n=1 Tax=Lachancea mirantina TaxID=1230905 RepID=A0A1G4KDY1_9SACH|nr:LAMI_0H02234g1_1 [Lachancea mirantina]